MKKVECIIQSRKVRKLLDRLDESDSLYGVTETAVRGCGRQRGRLPHEKASNRVQLRPCTKLEFVVPNKEVKKVVRLIVEICRTGQRGAGDGKIFVVAMEDAVRISTGEKGEKGIV
jgi:nitrogen regulatory protein P-II 1